MTATFTNPGDGTIILTFTYQEDLTKVSDTIHDAAHFLYTNFADAYGVYSQQNGQLIPFDQLTNAQVLSIIDRHVKRSVLQVAAQFRIDQAAAQAFNDPGLTLGE